MSPTTADDPATDAAVVRPWFLTRGRTHAELPIEALVVTTDAGAAAAPTMAEPLRAILRRCAEPTGVAEVAARVDLPLGVARVLIDDLAGDGLVSVATSDPDDLDIDFLERLIDGVRNS